MNVVSFIIYYIRLRVSVAFGFHYTAQPLGIKWRWEHWKQVQQFRRRNKLHLRNV